MYSRQNEIRSAIETCRTSIGIELGSTRIKTVLIGQDNMPIASGNYDWVSTNIDNVWTYDLDEVWKGIQGSYQKMAEQVTKMYGVTLKATGAIGISAMMHGYLAFDSSGRLLTPFRTWRNNFTGRASEQLTSLFNYPVPQRWSITHLLHAILNGEEHVEKLDYLTTLSGYIHWKLTGRKVIGIGDASGMFPIDKTTKYFYKQMMGQFNKLVGMNGFPWKIENVLPVVLVSGEAAGELTMEGAKILDTSGELQAGIQLCPPEGDAGTGMVATNSIAVRTGNVSAGTSVFAMIVLEKELSRVYSEIDLVTTPTGDLVAMVHSNNCTSDYDAWIGLFGEVLEALSLDVSKQKLYDTLLSMALKGEPDCGGLLSYGYIAGEHLTHFEEGRPLFVRSSNSRFNLANFMRVNLFTSLGALRTGLDLLFKMERIQVDEILGHGGFFKTNEVGQKIMAAAINVPVSVMETASEGGAWGIALLASYMVNQSEKETLADFLNHKVFYDKNITCISPDSQDVAGFNSFFKRYTQCLVIERSAVENIK